MQTNYRVQTLVNDASKREGSDTALASQLHKAPQVVSNWRTGHKKPSVEAQLDMAFIAGHDVIRTVLEALREEAPEPRKSWLTSLINDKYPVAPTARPPSKLMRNIDELMRDPGWRTKNT